MVGEGGDRESRDAGVSQARYRHGSRKLPRRLLAATVDAGNLAPPSQASTSETVPGPAPFPLVA